MEETNLEDFLSRKFFEDFNYFNRKKLVKHANTPI